MSSNEAPEPCLHTLHSQTQNLVLQQQRRKGFRTTCIRAVSVHEDAHAVLEEAEYQGQASWSLYNEPELYDRLFAGRDFASELQFLLGAYARHTAEGQAGGRPQSFVELGCGPARHAVEAWQQGMAQVTAVDDNRRMLEFARRQAAAAGATVRFLEGRLEELFSTESGLPEGFLHADLALLPLGTLAHALTNDDALRWLAAAGNALRPGGLLVLELPHPADVFDGALVEGDDWELAGVEEGDIDLRMEYGAPMDDFDPYTQIMQRSVAVSEADPANEEGDGWRLIGREMVPQRVFTLQEVRLLARIAGFSVEGLYGEMALEADLQHEEAYRLIVVLKNERT
ncbi:hypothetical protein WJX75_003778 [Coccomyxa subellipsoidea]|uniref:Methyltransferase domain-containing protein n=1 Tax=Coccomyxa subellipsoidea TaxID=248742 RepID=A0ABR2YB27_9CHLO